MRNLIRNFGFIILFLIPCTLFAQEDAKYLIDSLSAKVITGEPKLEILDKLAELETFSPNQLYRLDELDKEAKKQKNNRFLLLSYNRRINYYMYYNNSDSINRYTKLSNPIVKMLNPTDQIVAQNIFLNVINYTTRGLFDLALITQKKYLEKIETIGDVKPEILFAIYIGIGDAYYHQEKYGEALKYFDQAKELSSRIDNNPIRNVSSLCLVALCNASLKDYATAIQYCDSASSIINNNKKEITLQSSTYLNAYVNLIAIQAYVGLKDFRKAKPLVEQLLANLDASYYQEQESYCYSTLRVYYLGIEEYDEALKYNEMGLDHLKKNNNIITQPAFIKEKASLLYTMQNYKASYDELLFATQFADSIRSSYSATQLDELGIMYEVDLKDAEIARNHTQLKFTQAIIIALIAISILLLVILLIVRVNSQKQLVKNKMLFKQQEELRKRVRHYKKMIVDESYNDAPSLNPLFQKLENYMSAEEVYKKSDIKREDIATYLNTNRQYLSSAIKDATGLTFTSYINKYRLEDARKQLLENDEVVIDDVIIESGFSSRPTFHRLFKEQYGMAPYELKRAAVALQNEIIEEDKEDL